MMLGAGGGLLGGMALASAFDHAEDNGYEQGFDDAQGMDYGGGDFDGGGDF